VKGKSDVVSVKSNGMKRKADDVLNGVSPDKERDKKTRRGKKSKH